MVKVKIKIPDNVIDKKQGNVEITDYTLWDNFLISGLRSCYQNGIDTNTTLRLNRILDKISKGGASIELEDAEFEVLKVIRDKGRFDPIFHKIATVIINIIDDAIDNKKKDGK